MTYTFDNTKAAQILRNAGFPVYTGGNGLILTIADPAQTHKLSKIAQLSESRVFGMFDGGTTTEVDVVTGFVISENAKLPEYRQLLLESTGGASDLSGFLPLPTQARRLPPDIYRVMAIINESDDDDHKENQEWESRDEQPAINDPALWDGTDPNWQLDEQDWKALQVITESDSAESLDQTQLAFFEEIGLVEGGKPIPFAKELVQTLSKDRPDPER